MSVENRAEHQTHPGPSKELTQEMSLGTALRGVVDDLFTNQAIAERLRALTGDPEVEALLETWKRDLTGQLEETARLSVENAAGIIDLLQSAGATPSLVPQERQEWAEIAAWYKPFTVASICREDLRGILSDEEITTLSDHQMQQIADRIRDGSQESGSYWELLSEATRLVLGQQPEKEVGPESEAQPSMETQPDNDPTPPPDQAA